MQSTGDIGREKYNLGVAFKEAAKKLSLCDPRYVCLNSGVIYNREKNCYIVPYLNRKYLACNKTGDVVSLEDGSRASRQLQILILHYLACADGTPLKGSWITFKELPGGHIYVEPYQKRIIKPLLKYFGSDPEKFREIALTLGGEPSSFGDVGVVMRSLPKVPIAFVFWKGDEEFPPSANILYDASAAHYLPTEDYALLPGLIIWEMAARLLR